MSVLAAVGDCTTTKLAPLASHPSLCIGRAITIKAAKYYVMRMAHFYTETVEVDETLVNGT